MPSIAEVLTADYFAQDCRRASWRCALEREFALPYMRLLRRKLLKEEEEGHIICPSPEQIYGALEKTALQDVKVVIVGQDPYHQPGRAHGLAFSVANCDDADSLKNVDSLKNIIKEIERSIGPVPQNHGCLIPWAEQGVLLLNAVLTVREGCPDSHKGWGWECFTTRIIQTINKEREHVVFMLWGEKAQKNAAAIDGCRHKLLMAGHPSRPKVGKRPFSGCGHFSRANIYLVKHGKTPICWQNIR